MREAVDNPREAVKELAEDGRFDCPSLLAESIELGLGGVEQDFAAVGELDDDEVAQVLKKRDRELEKILSRGDNTVKLAEQRVGVTAENGVSEAGDREVARNSENDANFFAGDRRRLVSEGEHLVEQGQRVADGTTAGAGDQEEAGLLDRHTFGAEDSLHVLDQTSARYPAKIKTRNSREDRRR